MGETRAWKPQNIRPCGLVGAVTGHRDQLPRPADAI